MIDLAPEQIDICKIHYEDEQSGRRATGEVQNGHQKADNRS